MTMKRMLMIGGAIVAVGALLWVFAGSSGAMAADKSGLTGILTQPDLRDDKLKHFSGVYAGGGVVYSTGDLDTEIEAGPASIVDRFDFDTTGVRGSILAQSYMFNSNWVGGIEVGGSYTEDLYDFYGNLRFGYDLGRFMPYALAGVGFDIIDGGGGPVLNAEGVNYTGRLGAGLQWAATDRISFDLQFARVWGYGSNVTLGVLNADTESQRDEVSAQFRLKF